MILDKTNEIPGRRAPIVCDLSRTRSRCVTLKTPSSLSLRLTLSLSSTNDIVAVFRHRLTLSRAPKTFYAPPPLQVSEHFEPIITYSCRQNARKTHTGARARAGNLNAVARACAKEIGSLRPQAIAQIGMNRARVRACASARRPSSQTLYTHMHHKPTPTHDQARARAFAHVRSFGGVPDPSFHRPHARLAFGPQCERPSVRKCM